MNWLVKFTHFRCFFRCFHKTDILNSIDLIKSYFISLECLVFPQFLFHFSLVFHLNPTYPKKKTHSFPVCRAKIKYSLNTLKMESELISIETFIHQIQLSVLIPKKKSPPKRILKADKVIKHGRVRRKQL